MINYFSREKHRHVDIRFGVPQCISLQCQGSIRKELVVDCEGASAARNRAV